MVADSEAPRGLLDQPVGFIGLGQIGAPMARRLLDWPGGLVVADVSRQAVEPFAATGAKVANSAAEVVAAGARFISVMVLDDTQVRQVVDDIIEAVPHGMIVAIHSTIRPETAEGLAAAGREAGIEVLDAPVSGGTVGAQEGTLALLVGGTEGAVESARPVFDRYAGLVRRFGPAGMGTRAKITRNLISFAGFAAAGEAQRLAEAAGVDLRAMARVVRHTDAITGGIGSILLRDTTTAMAADDPLFEVLSHTRDLGEKDLNLAIEMARELGVELPIGRAALDSLAMGLGVTRRADG